MAIITTVVMIIIPEIGVITITDTIIMGGMVHVITMVDMDVVGKMNSAPKLLGLFFSSTIFIHNLFRLLLAFFLLDTMNSCRL
jgi:hypothetical protein